MEKIIISKSGFIVFDTETNVVRRPIDLYFTNRVARVDKGGQVITDDEIITQGDANNIRDKAISIEQVKGKVIKIFPKVGYVISFVQNPFFIVTIIVLVFVLMEHSYSKEKNKKSENLEALKAEIEKLKSEQ